MRLSRRVELMTRADAEAFGALLASGDAAAVNAWKPSKESVARMDEELLARINERVGKDDRLWIVGDFAHGRNADEKTMRAYRDAIRCRDVRLVWGNHDPRHLCEGLFAGTYDAVRLLITPKETLVEADLWRTHGLRSKRAKLLESPRCRVVYLSHYAHVVWHHSDRGVYHLYGHSHGNLEMWRERHMPAALSMDVGVDCRGYRPVSFAEVDKVLGAKFKAGARHRVDFRTEE
jgi:calcineurin-like phosphoesterase family protein